VANSNAQVMTITVPSLDYDWYSNSLGKDVEGMAQGQVKLIGETEEKEGTYVSLWFANAVKLGKRSCILAILHRKADGKKRHGKITISNIKYFYEMPLAVIFPDVVVYIVRGE
jgi:hypothetical protein